MTEQQDTTKKKAGSIKQYATLGRSKTPELSNAEMLRSLNVQESGSLAFREPERPGVQTPKRERERHTIYLPPEMSEWVKIHAIKTRREISEVVAEAVEQYRAGLRE